jgi:hypothetical protein
VGGSRSGGLRLRLARDGHVGRSRDGPELLLHCALDLEVADVRRASGGSRGLEQGRGDVEAYCGGGRRGGRTW